MSTPINYKRTFLTALVASLCISALLGIAVVLLGSFNDITGRILVTTICVGIFSLTGLCSAVLYEHKKYMHVALAGIGFSILSFLLSVWAIWATHGFDYHGIWKLLFICIVFAFSFAHASLLLLLRKATKNLEMVRWGSLGTIGVLALMIIILVLTEGNVYTEDFIRIMGVVAILDALGTIVTPILYKMHAMRSS